MKMHYVVLHQNDDGGFESTLFSVHKNAFNYCEKLTVKIKAVYRILSREPMTVGAINVFCSYNEQYCVLEQHFKSDIHNYTFKVI